MSLSHVVLVLIKGDREENTKSVLASLPVLSHRGCEEVLEVRADSETAKGKKPFPFLRGKFNKNIKEQHQKAGSCYLRDEPV